VGPECPTFLVSAVKNAATDRESPLVQGVVSFDSLASSHWRLKNRRNVSPPRDRWLTSPWASELRLKRTGPRAVPNISLSLSSTDEIRKSIFERLTVFCRHFAISRVRPALRSAFGHFRDRGSTAPLRPEGTSPSVLRERSYSKGLTTGTGAKPTSRRATSVVTNSLGARRPCEPVRPTVPSLHRRATKA